MHLEPPHVSLHSVKEVAAHYLMIVVSILTALGLEAAFEKLHHAHAAEAARQTIEVELRANVASVKDSLDQNVQRLAPLKELNAHLTQEMLAGTPKADLVAEIAQLVNADKIDLGLFTPTLRHEAWDVAVANQSASYIDSDHLGRFSSAYAEQRELGAGPLSPLLDGPRFVDALTDARVQAVDPQQFLRVLNQAIVTVSAMTSRLDALQHRLMRALPAETVEPAASSPLASSSTR